MIDFVFWCNCITACLSDAAPYIAAYAALAILLW